MGVILRYKDLIETYKTKGYRIKHLNSYSHLFPLKSSPILAGIIADLICDGHLQGDPKWRFDYTSKSKKELKRFEKNIKFLFNKGGKIRKCTSNKYSDSYNMGINSSVISRILFLCGVPSGQKVLKNFRIPKWIKENKENFREFCKRVFVCEGFILNEKNRIFPQIRLEMWKSEKLLGEKERFIEELCGRLKRYFNIDTTITMPKNRKTKRKDGVITRGIKVYILNKNVIKFYNEIGFEGNKQKSLKTMLSCLI